MLRQSQQHTLAPRSASPQYVVAAIKHAITLTPDDVFYDLGCGGDARILIAMAQFATEAAIQYKTQPALPHSSAADFYPCVPAAAEQLVPTAVAAPAAGGYASQLFPLAMDRALATASAGSQQENPELPQFVGVELNKDSARESKESSCCTASTDDSPATLLERAEHVAAKITIRQGDLLEVPLHDATVAYVYLLPQGLQLLANKLKKESTRGCTVLSYMFKVPGWEDYLQCCLPVTSGRPDRLDVSSVSKLWVYKL